MRLLVVLLAVTTVALAQGDGPAFFEKSVRPLLVARCLGCHGAANPAGGLRLDQREALLKGGARGPALVAGKPDQSLLLRVVRHQEGNLKMPPGPKLSDADAAVLARWIEMGAPWGIATGAAPAAKFWSFVKPEDPAAPNVTRKDWVRSPLDAFILGPLEQKGLKPAPPADKRTLIRRATFDLTGLPPTPEDVKAFLADDSPGAFAKVVDRLLASPRYGERWGRHWLDVARYADSNGLDENLVYKNAFRYRDYVIKAFNQDKPYDQFLHEQLAGDLLPASSDLQTTFDRWTATGFLTLGAKMLAEDDPVKMEMDIIDEQLDTTVRTFMGLTIGCARCHDHKFDPLPTADYYSLAGIFKSSKTMENFKVVAKWHEYVLAPAPERAKLAAHEALIEAKRKEARKITEAENATLTKEAMGKAGLYLMAAYDVAESGKLGLKALAPDAAGVVRTADSYEQGNVTKPLEKKKPNTPKDGKGPYFAEYRVAVTGAGLYQVDVLDEEKGAGTADLFVNGELVMQGAGPVQNREASEDAGGWSPLGVFAMTAGENVLKLQHRSRFPYFAKLRVAPSPFAVGAPVPRTPVQIAKARGVNPSFVVQMVEYLERSNGATASVLYPFEHYPTEDLSAWQSPFKASFANAKYKSRDDLAVLYGDWFRQALAAWEAMPEDERKKENAKLADAGLDPLRQLLFEKFGPFAAPDDAKQYYAPAAQTELARIDKEQKALEAATPDLPRAMGVCENTKITDLPIHIRGSHWTLGEKAPRRFPRALAGEQQPPLPEGASGRLEFARWLTTKDHPLTSRVMVNRLWRWHFGKGLVPSTDNFGRLGEKPTNQPLLDWLSHRFVESGWSVKAMHRLMMLSSTYQMSSAYDAKSVEADPENTLLWRANRRRLEAEAIRDAIMFVSGDLALVEGGSILTFKDRQYVANTSKRGGVDYEKNIRAVYIPVVRSSTYEVFTAFDLPDSSTPNGDRDATVVAPQALFMMNGTVALRHSKVMAQRLLALPGADDAARIREAYELALSRPPSPEEIDLALSFLGRIGAKQTDKTLIWQSFCKGLLGSNEFIYLN